MLLHSCFSANSRRVTAAQDCIMFIFHPLEILTCRDTRQHPNMHFHYWKRSLFALEPTGAKTHPFHFFQNKWSWFNVSSTCLTAERLCFSPHCFIIRCCSRNAAGRSIWFSFFKSTSYLLKHLLDIMNPNKHILVVLQCNPCRLSRLNSLHNSHSCQF